MPGRPPLRTGAPRIADYPGQPDLHDLGVPELAQIIADEEIPSSEQSRRIRSRGGWSPSTLTGFLPPPLDAPARSAARLPRTCSTASPARGRHATSRSERNLASRSGTVWSRGIRQIIAGGAVVGCRPRHKPEPTASSAKTALAAQNSSARRGCSWYGEPSDGPNEHVVFGGHEGSSTGVDIIRHVTTPATNSATAISDASTGTSHGCLSIRASVSRAGAVGSVGRRSARPRDRDRVRGRAGDPEQVAPRGLRPSEGARAVPARVLLASAGSVREEADHFRPVGFAGRRMIPVGSQERSQLSRGRRLGPKRDPRLSRRRWHRRRRRG